MTIKPHTIKKDGTTQRSDISLNKDIAITLTQIVLSGQTLYPKGQTDLEIEMPDGSKKRILQRTLKMWITRCNVIPETGEPLRELLDRAREQRKDIARKEMDSKREEIIDKKLNRVINLNTKEPVVAMFGVIKDENGKIIKKENVQLLSEQMKNVRFLAERLFPNRYAKVEKTENKHLVFSLAELRKYENENG